jgi:hypothetical protein
VRHHARSSELRAWTARRYRPWSFTNTVGRQTSSVCSRPATRRRREGVRGIATRCRAGVDCLHHRCCNPPHLASMPHAWNLQRAARRRRHRTGDACTHAVAVETANGLRCRTCLRLLRAGAEGEQGKPTPAPEGVTTEQRPFGLVLLRIKPNGLRRRQRLTAAHPYCRVEIRRHCADRCSCLVPGSVLAEPGTTTVRRGWRCSRSARRRAVDEAAPHARPRSASDVSQIPSP